MKTSEPIGPRIYNLFPLLAGKMEQWGPHLERARAMDFNWIFVNPFHLPGLSGSLYSIKDYYQLHPLLVDPEAEEPFEHLRRVAQITHQLGMRIMMDLVMNHTGVDSPLVREHPDWYQRGKQGEIVHPGALDGDRFVRWDDLAAIDNAESADRETLWRYWLRLVLHYSALGFDGFRCDAAYQVPAELWRFLIRSAREEYPRCQFFAETLGGTMEQTLRVAQAGFDFIFNSSKWWNFSEPWCLEQYGQSAPAVRSISFPESHDTGRLAAEAGGSREAVRQRYVLAALFATGVMIPIGFEYGFRRRLHVVATRPEDWEQPSWDDTGFIRQVNLLKQRHRVWNEEGPMESLDIGNAAILALLQTTLDETERSLLLFNRDRGAPQGCRLPGKGWVETFLDEPARSDAIGGEASLPPCGFRIFLGA